MSGTTIYALATGAPRSRLGAGIAVIRVSGPATAEAIRRLATGRGLDGLPPPRQASLRRIVDPVTGETLDRGLVLWFPGPGSVTGEDYAEFHVHGGRAVIEGVLGALASVPGLGLAGPGDFARRSFENGKLDLTAVEGIADLVQSETAAQRRQALRQMSGELGRLYDSWRERLLRSLAHVEAAIDFADEDLPPEAAVEATAGLPHLRGEIAAHLQDRRGERLREGLAVAIIGAPNVGKSSLLNRLVRREAAIVSPVAGTTRDLIEVHLDLGGWPVTLIDTAGLRDSDDPVEQEGVRRARRRAAEADVRLHVIAIGEDGVPPAGAEMAAAAGSLEGSDGDAGGKATLVVVNKIDLVPVDARDHLVALAAAAVPQARLAAVSAATGDGIAALAALLAEVVAAVFGSDAGQGTIGEPPLTQHRHREALVRCVEALDRALDAAGCSIELLAEDLRIAARELGRITGRVAVEDVLDVIFRDFCIGK